jgi:sec-independent protein translocase protein TatB
MMIGMSFSETIFLFFLALVIFGPKKLPEIARQVGKYLNEFKRASNEFKAQIEQEIAHLEVEKPRQTILPPSPAVEGATSRTLNSPPVEETKVEESKVETSAPAEAATPEAATLASSAEEHGSISGNGAPPPVATEAVPAAEEVTSNTSQESHA